MTRLGNAWVPTQQVRLSAADYQTRKPDEGPNLNQYDRGDDVPVEVEATLLAVWRRVLTEGGGPELTLPEAAALLGTSVESVRRRIKAGQIRAFYDERGRVRIVATVTPPPELALPEVQIEDAAVDVAYVWEELHATRAKLELSFSEKEALQLRIDQAYLRSEDTRKELNEARSEAQVLQDELDNVREALEYTQGELAAMWRVMSSRSERLEPAQRFALTDGNEAFDLARGRAEMSEERLRIQSQITRVRDLSRRRRWPWPQAS